MHYFRAMHPYYCGVDLDARTMFAPVLDADGKTVVGGGPNGLGTRPPPEPEELFAAAWLRDTSVSPAPDEQP